MNVLYGNLKAIETTRLWDLHFLTESLDQVLVDDAVGSGEERQDARYEISFIRTQLLLPILFISLG